MAPHHVCYLVTHINMLIQGLRLHDNPALQRAIAIAETVYPVFCLDPWFFEPGRVGGNRITFLLQSLADLDASLKQVQSRLIVLHGKPTEVLPAVARIWDAKAICFEEDTEPYALARDARVVELVKQDNIAVRH
jgi:cryptochrome